MTYRGENGTNGSHLAVFCTDIAFVVAPHPPLTLPPYRSASGIGYASKKLSKMARNSARLSSVHQTWRIILNSYGSVAKHMQEALIILKIY